MLTDAEKKKIRLIQNEYHKKWRKQNPEKVKAINEKFWKNKLKKQNEQENRKDDKNETN